MSDTEALDWEFTMDPYQQQIMDALVTRIQVLEAALEDLMSWAMWVGAQHQGRDPDEVVMPDRSRSPDDPIYAVTAEHLQKLFYAAEDAGERLWGLDHSELYNTLIDRALQDQPLGVDTDG